MLAEDDPVSSPTPSPYLRTTLGTTTAGPYPFSTAADQRSGAGCSKLLGLDCTDPDDAMDPYLIGESH